MIWFDSLIVLFLEQVSTQPTELGYAYLSLPLRFAWSEPRHFSETHVLVPCASSGAIVPQTMATIHAIPLEIGRTTWFRKITSWKDFACNRVSGTGRMLSQFLVGKAIERSCHHRCWLGEWFMHHIVEGIIQWQDLQYRGRDELCKDAIDETCWEGKRRFSV